MIRQFPKTNEDFRLLYDTKGRFRLHAITGDETKFKLCKVRSVQFGQKGIPYLNTYDGRTIRYPDPLIKANGTIKLDLESNEIVDFIKFDVGNVVVVTGGRNRGRVGVLRTERSRRVASRQSTFKMLLGMSLQPIQAMCLQSVREQSHGYPFLRATVSSYRSSRKPGRGLQPKLRFRFYKLFGAAFVKRIDLLDECCLVLCFHCPVGVINYSFGLIMV